MRRLLTEITVLPGKLEPLENERKVLFEYSELNDGGIFQVAGVSKSYGLTRENQYYEIEVYPFRSDREIAEIELSDENADIRFPEQVKVFK